MIIELDREEILYSGRIDKTNLKKPEFIFPASFVQFSFVGSKLEIEIKNKKSYGISSVGVILDGKQKKYELNDDGITLIEILNSDVEEEHSVMIFKRMDSCHTYSVEKIELNESAKLLKSKEKPKRRIEVYGDSISCGAVSEALDYVGKSDPEDNNGIYDNSWYSYSWIFARSVGAELHNVSQGGIPLMQGTGWVSPPLYLGMEDMWDKVHYHPDFNIKTKWDFEKYTPHLVIVAIGQNDSNPEDFMKENPKGEKAKVWKERYKNFILGIRKKYPRALILLTTTLLNHDESWDDAIETVCLDIKDDKVKHFMYKRNGKGSPGHLRIPEAEEMANELKEYIETLGFDIWEN